MGCLKSILYKIFFLTLIVAFFACGGWTFVQKKVNDYKNPPRNVFIESEKSFADFSLIPSDYQLSRSFNLFGYKKINAKYLPTGQKITIYDLRDEDKISVSDFTTGEINTKIDSVLKKLKDSIITFEEFQIVQKGSFIAKGKTIPFIRFSAKVKNIPFKNVIGVVACYSSENEKAKTPSTKLIVTMVDTKAYNPTIHTNFISALRF